MDYVLEKVADHQTCCRVSVASDLFLDVLKIASDVLHEMMKPVGLKVFWTKSNVQSFEDLLIKSLVSTSLVWQ